jgi:S-adenosylmethionine/arginine decarboxylase-like enzyme
MFHFMLDAYKGYRSRLDDFQLVNEMLEEIPAKFGLKPVMPPFILPYYNGVTPDDCGISSFVFLNGGHFTLHTFSFREAYFADLVSPDRFDPEELAACLLAALPARTHKTGFVERKRALTSPMEATINEAEDFGPHLLMNFPDYRGPASFEEIFDLFDMLPAHIGMTPIMRPYIVKSAPDGKRIVSAMTMIAESHISLHYFPETREAYFDLFSCRFFDSCTVIPKIKRMLRSECAGEVLFPRGSKFHMLKQVSEQAALQSRTWLNFR